MYVYEIIKKKTKIKSKPLLIATTKIIKTIINVFKRSIFKSFTTRRIKFGVYTNLKKYLKQKKNI